MKRSITDVLRRGFESAYANWQLIALRIAENIVFAFLIIVSIIAAVVPLLVSIGLAAFDLERPHETAANVGTALLEHLAVFVWIFLGALLLALLLMVIHSFVMAGCARIFVDAERGRVLKTFSMERWLSGGRESVWTVFWIYNIAYGTTMAIVLVPLLIALAAMLAFRDSDAAIMCSGCLGIVAAVFLGIIACVVAAIWSLKAIILALDRDLGATAASKIAWAEARADFGRHFAVAFILFVIGFGGAATIGSMSIFVSVPAAHDTYMSLAFAPARILISMVQGAFSAAVGMWMLASFAALSDK